MGEPTPGSAPAHINKLFEQSKEPVAQVSKDSNLQTGQPTETAINLSQPPDRLDQFRQEIIDNIGFIPVSSKETQRFMRGTSVDEAIAVCDGGYGIERVNGFSGNAVALGFDEAIALDSINYTHRGVPVALFFTYPNVRPDIVKLQREGQLPRPFRGEVLATNFNLDPFSVRASMMTDSELVIDPQFVEGYYDKDEKKYHTNPKYWENILKEKAEKESWTREEYETHRQEQSALLRQQALQRLSEESIFFKKTEKENARDFLAWEAKIGNGDGKDVEIPIP